MKLFRPKISSLRNVESGKRIFILASGPSVNELNLERLKDEIVIGMNASTMLEHIHGFNSKYYVISDLRFLNSLEKRKWGTTELSEQTIRVLRNNLKAYDDPDLSNDTFYVPALNRDGFSHNLSLGFNYGCTTTMLAIQLAWYLGSREVYLLGCDLKYTEESPRFYEESEPQLEDSFTSVQIFNISNAAKEFSKDQGILASCSPDSFLRSYIQYVDFRHLFND